MWHGFLPSVPNNILPWYLFSKRQKDMFYMAFCPSKPKIISYYEIVHVFLFLSFIFSFLFFFFSFWTFYVVLLNFTDVHDCFLLLDSLWFQQPLIAQMIFFFLSNFSDKRWSSECFRIHKFYLWYIWVHIWAGAINGMEFSLPLLFSAFLS